MADKTPQDLVHDSVIDADYRARYFGRLASIHRERHQRIAILNGVLTSGALLAVVAPLPEPHAGFLVQVLLILAVVVSWIAVVKQDDEGARVASHLLRRWLDIQRQAELLLSRLESMEDQQVRNAWKKLETTHDELDEMAAGVFAYDRKMQRDVWEETMQARGLDTV